MRRIHTADDVECRQESLLVRAPRQFPTPVDTEITALVVPGVQVLSLAPMRLPVSMIRLQKARRAHCGQVAAV